jgi:pimeloyl-ACP methyl ester carboxylesterase
MSLNKRKSPYSNRYAVLAVLVVGVLLVLAAIAFRSFRYSRRPGALTPPISVSSARPSTTSPTLTDLTGETASAKVLAGGAAEPVTIEFVDTSRPLISGGDTLDQARRLPTTVWHPEAAGVYPLVVFAHGYEVGPLTYARFCAMLASLGFVVAAPSFPLADESRGNGLDRSDIPNEAGDINFVIAQLRGSDPTISNDPVTVIGHSDGATAALIVAERQGDMNPAVGAVVAIAPDALTNDLGTNPPPVLIIHGTDDPIASFADGQGNFERFSGSRFLLALDGADHLAPIVGDTPWTPVLDRAVGLFLAGIIEHRAPSDDAALTAALDELDLSYARHAG